MLMTGIIDPDPVPIVRFEPSSCYWRAPSSSDVHPLYIDLEIGSVEWLC